MNWIREGNEEIGLAFSHINKLWAGVHIGSVIILAVYVVEISRDVESVRGWNSGFPFY